MNIVYATIAGINQHGMTYAASYEVLDADDQTSVVVRE